MLQQANLVMWEKLDEFLGCENFDALACRVAYYQVLAHRRDKFRERRRLLFDDQLIERLAATAGGKTDAFQGYLATLRDCMAKLCRAATRAGAAGGTSRAARWAPSPPTRGDSPNAVSASLYRIRKNLLACIRDELAKDRDR